MLHWTLYFIYIFELVILVFYCFQGEERVNIKKWNMVVLVLRNLKLFSIWLQQFIISPTVDEGSFVTASSTLVILTLFDGNHLDRWKVVAHSGLICIFLMISGVEHLLMCLLAIYTFSLKNVYSGPLSIFLFVFTGVYLLYIAVLVSAVLQSVSAVCIYVSSLFWISFPIWSPESTE